MKITTKIVDHGLWKKSNIDEIYISYGPANGRIKYYVTTLRLDKKWSDSPMSWNCETLKEFKSMVNTSQLIYIGNLDELDLEAFIVEKLGEAHKLPL